MTKPIRYGERVVFYEHANQNSVPFLGDVHAVYNNGTVADLTVMSPHGGQIVPRKNVPHIADPNLAKHPAQRRFGAFERLEEYQARWERQEVERKARATAKVFDDSLSPTRPSVQQSVAETPEEMIRRLWKAGHELPFITELVGDRVSWPFERVQEQIDFLKAEAEEESEKTSKKRKAKEPALS